MTQRDLVKLAFQYQETEYLPYDSYLVPEQEAALTVYYGDESWREMIRPWTGWIASPDNFLACEQLIDQPDGSKKDCLGCSWMMGSTHHLVGWPLAEPKLGSYRLPDLAAYYEKYLKPRWPEQLERTNDRFRLSCHTFGLFERAWSLRGFENFLLDLVENESFVEELLDLVTEWFLESVDLMAEAPLDGIMLTDDHADQRGIIMGEERWRRLFRPRWRRVFDRIHHYGLYTVMHMCGNTGPVVGDLIDIGLDCMESCQPECMDIYDLKKRYGRSIRFWGGLGAQRVLPFGSPDEVRAETRRLKTEMGRGGGYILAGAKGLGEEVPIANIAAYLEEASSPRLA